MWASELLPGHHGVIWTSAEVSRRQQRDGNGGRVVETTLGFPPYQGCLHVVMGVETWSWASERHRGRWNFIVDAQMSTGS